MIPGFIPGTGVPAIPVSGQASGPHVGQAGVPNPAPFSNLSPGLPVGAETQIL